MRTQPQRDYTVHGIYRARAHTGGALSLSRLIYPSQSRRAGRFFTSWAQGSQLWLLTSRQKENKAPVISTELVLSILIHTPMEDSNNSDRRKKEHPCALRQNNRGAREGNKIETLGTILSLPAFLHVLSLPLAGVGMMAQQTTQAALISGPVLALSLCLSVPTHTRMAIATSLLPKAAGQDTMRVPEHKGWVKHGQYRVAVLSYSLRRLEEPC